MQFDDKQYNITTYSEDCLYLNVIDTRDNALLMYRFMHLRILKSRFRSCYGFMVAALLLEVGKCMMETISLLSAM